MTLPTEQTLNYTDEELLKMGLECLDESLSFIMEMKSFEGRVLAQLIYNAFAYGEHAMNEDRELDIA